MSSSATVPTENATSEALDATLAWALREYGDALILATSLGAEDMVLLDALDRASRTTQIAARAFFLDTGRMHEETYQLLDRARDRYRVTIDSYFPDTIAVEALVRSQGTYGMRASIEARKSCCAVRKLNGLERALVGKRAWITGLRREQSTTRQAVELVEPDATHAGVVKVNPLVAWSWPDVLAYLDQHEVPRSPLHAAGYLSIGCAPCTRAVAPGEDLRAGRWWWESPEHKECGLHVEHKK